MIFQLYIGNELGPKGAEALAQVLPEMHQLTNLELQGKLL